MDLRAVRRGALHRELRRRPRRTTSPQRRKQSPQRCSSRSKGDMEDRCRQHQQFVENKQLLTDEVLKPREHLSSKEDVLSSDVLKSIEDHKSFIAELRPNRRKIKWGSALADWERNNSSQTRISDLSLDDLQIHGKVPIAPEAGNYAEQSEPEQPQKLGDQIDILEKNIRRCFKTINRVKKEANKQKERAIALQEENKSLRKAIIALPFPQSQSMRQSWKQMVATVEAMRLTVTQMDEQIMMINSRKFALQQEAEQLRTEMHSQLNREEEQNGEDRFKKEEVSDERSVMSATDYGYNEYPEEGKSSYFQLSFGGVPTVALINNGNSATMTRRMSATPRAA